MAKPHMGLGKPICVLVTMVAILLLVITTTSTAFETPPESNSCHRTATITPRTMTLDFHHSQKVVAILDLKTKSDDWLQEKQLFLTKISQNEKKLSFWGDLFRPILVDYLPDSFFLIHTTGEYLISLQNTYGTGVFDVIVFPEELRVARDVSHFLAIKTTSPPPSTLKLQLERYNKLNEQGKVDEKSYRGVYFQEQTENMKFNHKKNENIFIQNEKNKEENIFEKNNFENFSSDEEKMDQGINQKKTISINNLYNIQSVLPDRVLQHDQMFDSLVNTVFSEDNFKNSCQNDQKGPSTPKLTSSKLLQNDKKDETSIQNTERSTLQALKLYFSSLPELLQNFEDLYQEIISDFSTGITFDDPQAFQHALDIDTPTIESTKALIGQLESTATQSFLFTFTQDNVDYTNRQIYGDAMTRDSQDLLGKLQEIIGLKQNKALENLRSQKNIEKNEENEENEEKNENNTQNIDDSSSQHTLKTSLQAVSDVFSMNGFDIDIFMDKYEEIFEKLTKNSHKSQNFQQNSVSKSTLFPFNIAIQHSLEPMNTISTSNIAMNTARVQFQSPLFLSNTTFIVETLSTRLNTFQTLISSLIPSQHLQDNKNQSVLTQFDDILIKFDEIKELLAEQYYSQIFSSSGRSYFYNNPHKMKQYTQYSTYEPGYNVRAHMVQHLDALIIAVYESNIKKIMTQISNFSSSFENKNDEKKNIDNNNDLLNIVGLKSQSTTTTTTPGVNAILMNTLDVSDIILSLIQHQIDVVNNMTSHGIFEILSEKTKKIKKISSESSQNLEKISSSIYHIELDTKASLFNNYARFALTVGLDNIPIDYDVPTGMSYTGPYFDAGLTGRGITVSVCDSGSDYGSCYLMDSDTTHPVPFTTSYTTETASKHRKFKSYLVLGDKFDYVNGHGTHTSGSVSASCIQQGSQSRSVQNGALPESQLAFVDFATSTKIVNTDFSIIFQHAVNNGAIITSNSWGNTATKINHIAQNNKYTASESRIIDQLLNTNQNIAALFASSNDGLQGFATLAPQSTAKNSIAIGSTQASKSQGVRAKESNGQLPAFLSSPSAFDNLHNLYGGSSSMGPTYDGRIKPDFVAPGASVASIAATATSSYSCAWTLKTGTSMATPTSAGLWGMMQQILMEGRVNSGTPRSSQSYPKEMINGPLLRAIAMNAAQRIHYRSNYIEALPQPMKIQVDILPQITVGSVTYQFFPLGEVGQIPGHPTNVNFLYLKPTTNNQFVTTTKRVIRLITYFGCKSETLQVQYAIGDKNGPTGQVKEKIFNFQTTSEISRDTLDIPLSSDQYIFLRILTINPACSESGNSVTFTFQEFIGGDSYLTSQRFQDVTCSERYDDFPTYTQPNFSYMNRRYIRCPPTPSCTDQFDQSLVYGNRHFSTNSSICRAALHTGAMNMTLYDIKDIDEAQKHILYGKREMVMANYQEPSVRPEPKSTWYGVTSQYLNTAAIDPKTKDYVDVDVFGFEVTGEPIKNDNGQNNLNYLRILPRHQNFASGYGIPKLSTVFPLTQHVLYKPGQGNKNTVQRFISLLRTGAPNHSITDQTAQSFCVHVSSKPLANTYKITTENDKWTSGEDSFRVSLTWYDPPSSPSVTNGKVLINDLDLFVFGPDGTEYRGNQRADHINNGERVDLLQGTFTPGMFCAVVHGVNIPIGPQRYSLVANGRGLEFCQKNPLKSPLSGVFVRDKDVQCSASSVFDDNLHNLSPDPEQSQFHKSVDTLQIRSGGDCFSIHDVTYINPNLKPNTFHQQRLSSTQNEDLKNWEKDSIESTASTSLPKKLFTISGKFNENGVLTGEYYRYLTNPSYNYDLPLEEQIIEDPSSGNVNSIMMEDNIEFDILGQIDDGNKILTLVIKGSKRSCRYTFHRKTQYEDVQFS